MSDEKRMAGDYEIIQAVQIGDREIVMGENPAATDGLLYMVAFYESNAIMGRYYDAEGSDDFPEIMEIYGQRIMEQAQKTRVELSKPKIQGIDDTPITAGDCTLVSYGDDLYGKVIVIKPEVLRYFAPTFIPGGRAAMNGMMCWGSWNQSKCLNGQSII